MKAVLICVMQLQSLTSHFTATRATFTKAKQVSIREDQCQAKCVAYHIHSCQPAKPAAAAAAPQAIIDS